MQLQKQLSRKVGTKTYIKWVIVIPPSDIKITEFKEGQHLTIQATKDKLTIKTKKKE